MKVDFQLRKMSAEEKLHIKYVLFKYNNSNERMSGLKLNQLTNTELRYEQMDNTEIQTKQDFKVDK